jgi:hypothetical protein
MRDEIYDRDYQFARASLSRDIVLLFQAIGSAFRVLARHRNDAPWKGDYRSLSDCEG